MAEETEGQDTGRQATAGGVDPVAVALSLGAASPGKADAFLEEQTRLARLQARELDHELSLRHWSLWVHHLSGVLKLAFELSITLVLLGVVALLANTVWTAAHDNGLVIEAFSVPPDLAARGLTGQVVATQMLDNLSALQALNNSARAPSSFANNWGDDIKVEIPETGVSIGELNTYLHRLLGNQTHITGEVVRTPSGVAITARLGAAAGKRFSGPETDFDTLLQQATDAVYAITQPYRYAINLFDRGKVAEATAFLADATRTLPPGERAWAYAGLFNMYATQHRAADMVEVTRASVALNPDFAWGWSKVGVADIVLGRAEAELVADRNALRLFDGPGANELRPEAVPTTRQGIGILIDELLGDYSDALVQIRSGHPALVNSSDPARQIQEILLVPGANISSVVGEPAGYVADLIGSHDVTDARRLVAEAPAYLAAVKIVSDSRHDIRGQADVDSTAQSFRDADMLVALARQDWPLAAADAAALDAEEAKLNAAYAANFALYPPTTIWPARALAEAKMGNLAVAHAWIDKTPGDCDLCLRTRGQIDAAEKNYGGAAFWFAMAAQKAPSIPFAYTGWGQALLARGDANAAIAKFKTANQKGPHFADPLEGWGEALMAQNRSDLALAKFAEAEKYATNWGRLHLKWGEALGYAGKKDEAKKQFSLAAGLDLAPAEKVELARQSLHA